MRTYLECVPCFFRQALDAARAARCTRSTQEDILRRVAAEIPGFDLTLPPPVMGQRIHRIVRQLSGDPDPYEDVKSGFNTLMMALLPDLRDRIADTPDPLRAALALAGAGNVIDFGPASAVDASEVQEQLRTALQEPPATDEVERFEHAAARARVLLYIADNAGEIVLDRLLIEHLIERYRAAVTLGVRGRPVLNDALKSDAADVGLSGMIPIIENGSDAPGTLLEDCSPEFRAAFQHADMVVSKGQGNYETLSATGPRVWFLLKVKCPVLAADLGCEVGEIVVRRGAAGPETRSR